MGDIGPSFAIAAKRHAARPSVAADPAPGLGLPSIADLPLAHDHAAIRPADGSRRNGRRFVVDALDHAMPRPGRRFDAHGHRAVSNQA